MKKALVILILLAFVGGGLFAQTFAWSGLIEAAVGAISRDADEEVGFGLLTPGTPDLANLWGRLALNYTHADGNSGAVFFIEHYGTPVASNVATNIYFARAYGWFKMFDGFAEFQAGPRTWDRHINPQLVHTTSHIISTAPGVMAHIFPTDMLTFGFGVFARGSLDEPIGAILNATPWEDNPLRLYFGFRANVPGTVDIRGQLDYQGDAGGTHAWLSASTNAVQDIPITVGAILTNLNDFGDTGRISANAQVGLNMIDNLALNFGLGVSNSNVENTDLGFMLGTWLTYTVTDMVSPRIAIFYSQAADYGWAVADTFPWTYMRPAAYTHNGDQSYVGISPRLRLIQRSNNYLEFGAQINLDLGDVPISGSTADQNMSWHVFATVHASF